MQIIFCFCVIFITALASGVSIKGKEEWPTVLTLLQVELEYRNFLVFCFFLMALSGVITLFDVCINLLAGHGSLPAVWCCWRVDSAKPVCLSSLPPGQNTYVSDLVSAYTQTRFKGNYIILLYTHYCIKPNYRANTGNKCTGEL